MSEGKYTSDSTLRALDMLELLCGAVPDGMANKDIATALKCPASTVTRTVDTLISKGWAERTPGGLFRLTSRFPRLTFRVLASFESAGNRLEEMKRNYTLTN
jgi:DNA-binding IclR family transcriptional regulator